MVEKHVWQRAAVALVEHACGYELGRSKDDPVYAEVTEGRDDTPFKRKTYSSCADLGHWLLQRLGVRELFLNRDDNAEAGDPWKPIVNVGALAFSKIAKTPSADWQVEPGDILILWSIETGEKATTDAHVCVALEQKGDKLLTGNYGAGGMQSGAWPGARLSWQRFSCIGGRWYYGPKKVQRVLRLEDYTKLVTAPPNLRGASMTGEDLDALGAVE